MNVEVNEGLWNVEDLLRTARKQGYRLVHALQRIGAVNAKEPEQLVEQAEQQEPGELTVRCVVDRYQGDADQFARVQRPQDQCARRQGEDAHRHHRRPDGQESVVESKIEFVGSISEPEKAQTQAKNEQFRADDGDQDRAENAARPQRPETVDRSGKHRVDEEIDQRDGCHQRRRYVEQALAACLGGQKVRNQDDQTERQNATAAAPDNQGEVRTAIVQRRGKRRRQHGKRKAANEKRHSADKSDRQEQYEAVPDRP